MNSFKRSMIYAGLVSVAVFFGGCSSDASFQNFGTLLRAEYNLEIRDYQAARRLAREVLIDSPQNTRALLVVGWSEFKLGNYASALEAFQRTEAIDGGSNDYGPQSGIAWSYFKLGKLEEAKANFLKAKARPRHYYENWDINDGLGWIAYSSGDLNQADKFFAWQPHACVSPSELECSGNFPDSWGWQKDSWAGRGFVAMSRDQLGKARSIFSEGTSKDREYFRNYDGLARTALLDGRYEEALEWATKAAERVDYDEGLGFLLEAIVERLGTPERGVGVLAGLVGRSGGGRGYYPFLGRLRLKMGQLKEAEADFLKALEFKPDDDWAKSELAETRRKMNDVVADGWKRHFDGDYEKALAIFNAKQRQADQSGNPAAEAGRGWALLSLGRIPEAKQSFATALRIDPNFDTAADGAKAAGHPHQTLYDQAWVLAEAGKFDHAKRQFLRAATQAPNDFQWKIDDGLAWLLFYRKKTDMAEAAFRQVLKKFPDAYLSRKGLGYVALQRNDYAAAAQHLFASLAQEPKQVVTSYTYPADGLLAGRQYETARKLLELGQRVYPDSPDIQFLLAKAYKGLGDPTAAAAKALNAATLAPVYIDPGFDGLGLAPTTVRDVYLALATGLYRVGDNAGAVKRINDYLAAGGTDPRGIRIRGFALFRQARYAEANRDLAYAAAQEPEHLPAVTEVLPITGAGQLWKIVYDARSTLAWSYFRTGDAARAAAQFQAVIKTDPAWIDALTGLGYSLLSLGDKQAALKYFRRALIVSPGYPDAWRGVDMAEKPR